MITIVNFLVIAKLTIMLIVTSIALFFLQKMSCNCYVVASLDSLLVKHVSNRLNKFVVTRP
jgi:hypothetical protein